MGQAYQEADRMLWLKLNIYSLLLSLTAFGILFAFCTIPFLYCTWWAYGLLLVSFGIVQKAADIFEQFPKKKEIYCALREKANAHYDQRYFVLYMGTACMRHIVFWVLFDLGKTGEYSCLKKRYEEARLRRSRG